MASTFSPTLRLELIGDGDQSGIWGQTTNTNLGTLLEQAITGVVSITMTDANYTLTSFNGVSDEARNAVLVVGGTNAAVRDIIAPLAEKLYVVRNNTIGGFAINIRASSGSSVSVPNGATVWVYCDGTNFNAINTESVGNFEVNGNLTVTGNTNAVAATYTGNVVALNYSTAGNVSATNLIGAGLGITSINASNISAGTIANARTTASSSNGASTIVLRDSNGSFAANVGTFTTVTGDGSALSSINASNLSSGTVASARVSGSYTGITGVGTLTAGTWNANTLAVAYGGTGVTSSTGSGSVVLSASPALTGTPTAPTAANGTSTTQIATTSFVNSAVLNATGSLGTMASQNANSVSITGGSISGISALPVASGGTGQTTYTNGQLLIGNSSGNTLTKATLTAGTGIAITNGSGAITIASNTISASSNTPTSGYITFINGTIMQWGQVTGTASSQSISFPIAFPNAVVSITAQFASTGSTGSSSWAVNQYTTTGFVFIAGNPGATTFWFAVGY